MYKLKIKYLSEDAIKLSMPRKGDIGIDLYANESVTIKRGSAALIGTGVSIQAPVGFWLQLVDRSSVSKHLHVMAGIIDTAYRGEIKVRAFCHTGKLYVDKDDSYIVAKGDKIAQLIIRKDWNSDFDLEEVMELEMSERGEDGFGSTGQ